MEAPIIFIHYNDSPYLKYTLRAAKIFNPQKRVILIGDASNKKYAKYGIEHFNFDEYTKSSELEAFHKVYKRIGGVEFEKMNKRKGGTDWTKFNFMKWFVLFNFVKRNEITRFWTFDSDNLVLTSLDSHEAKFNKYDCTEQNYGQSMQGLINNVDVLEGFINKINELFQRKDYFEKHYDDFLKNPTYGFTMMRAYNSYKEEVDFNAIRLTRIIEGSTFLDFVFHSDEMETFENQFVGNLIKKLFYDERGDIYTFHKPSNQYVRVNTIDLSWVPIFLFDKIFKIGTRKAPSIKLQENGVYNLISLDEPFHFTMRRNLSKVKRTLLKVLNYGA